MSAMTGSPLVRFVACRLTRILAGPRSGRPQDRTRTRQEPLKRRSRLGPRSLPECTLRAQRNRSSLRDLDERHSAAWGTGTCLTAPQVSRQRLGCLRADEDRDGRVAQDRASDRGGEEVAQGMVAVGAHHEQARPRARKSVRHRLRPADLGLVEDAETEQPRAEPCGPVDRERRSALAVGRAVECNGSQHDQCTPVSPLRLAEHRVKTPSRIARRASRSSHVRGAQVESCPCSVVGWRRAGP